jgi:hypothetical protein
MARSPAQPVTLQGEHLRFGRVCRISFQRTLRVPVRGPGEENRPWPLPPSLGSFPVFRVKPYASRLPPDWRARGGYFLPLYQREALWIAFDSAPGALCAVEIGAGGVNVVSGEPFAEGLSAHPQNYVVTPDQPWLDGINSAGSETGEAVVRQFVAMPLGSRTTVEAQITGAGQIGGLQIRVYPARPGVQPHPPSRPKAMAAPMSMGIAAGGEIRQKIYPDPYGIDVWDVARRAEVFVHLLNSAQFRKVTGLKPPPTPVKPQTYTKYGFPWFALYDEHKPALARSEKLSKVRPASEIEGWKEEPLTVDDRQIAKLRRIDAKSRG